MNPTVTQCLSDEVSAALTSGHVQEPERGRLISHIAECQDCRLLVGDVLAPYGANNGRDPKQPESATVDGRPRRIESGREPEPTPQFAPSAFDTEDRFTLLGELGRGGMGRVDEAFDRTLDRTVALKHLLSTDAVDIERFEREARITARLEHPSIVPIYDVGRSVDGTPYYVMRRIDGQPLDAVVDGRSLTDRLALIPNVLAACDAAAYAHARNVIHRDIKPTNILIGRFGETLLIDWGIARTTGEVVEPHGAVVSDPDLTRAGAVAGTPGFMAPEQARGERVDARADVFALGATLFYVLSGQLAYPTTNATELVDHVGADRPPEWRRIPDDAPLDLRAIVVKAMATTPGERYADAGALAADLRRFITGKLVGAYRYGPLEQLRRFARRHRTALAVGLIALVVIVVVAIGAVRRVVAERDEATHERALADVGRREATQARDQLLVQNAMHLVETDPAAAIVALRRLTPDSTQWGNARVVAAAAAAKGIPFGFAVPRRLDSLEISPDSRSVLLTTLNGDHLQIFDLESRIRDEIDAGMAVEYVRWLDDRWIAATTATDLLIVDRQTRKHRTIAYPAGVTHPTIGGGSGKRAWILSAEGSVYAIAPELQAFAAPLATSVTFYDEIAPGRVAVVHDAKLDVVTPRGTIEVPVEAPVKNVSVTGGRAIVSSKDRFCLWDLREAPTQRYCKAGTTVAFAMNGDEVTVLRIDGIWSYDIDGHPRRIVEQPAPMFATPRGYVIGFADGQWMVRDGSHRYWSSPRSHRYVRLQESADGRYVVATTTTNDLLIWNLLRDQPRSLQLGAFESLVGLNPTSLYTLDVGSRVVRIDRVTQARETVLTGPISSAMLATDESWLVGVLLDRSLIAVELSGDRKRVELPVDTGFALDRGALFFVDGDGIAWRLGGGRKARLGAFPGPPSAIAAKSGFIAAALSGDRLCRLVIATQSVTCIHPTSAVGDFLVTEDGVVYFIASGDAMRWDGLAAPSIVTTPHPILGLTWSGATPVVLGSHSITDLRVVPRIVSIPSMQQFWPFTSERLIGLTPQNRLVEIDLASGFTFELPFPTASTTVVLSDGRSIGVARETSLDSREILLWESPVPDEIPALQAWLGSVSNVRPRQDSDLVEWP